MASSGKHKTTMAKLTREAKLRERRVEKNARKQVRKSAQADGTYDPFAVYTDADSLRDAQGHVIVPAEGFVDPEAEAAGTTKTGAAR
jgi:hypothetical protein